MGILYLLLIALNWGNLQAEYCTTGFSVVAPELAVPGRTTAVLVTLHGPRRLVPVNVTLRLLSDVVEEQQDNGRVAEVVHEITGHGIIPLAVPSDISGSYVLQTLLNCSKIEDCDMQTSSRLRLGGSVRDVIIRPAKHSYRPGETISFWVLALDHNLHVASDVLGSVHLQDPSGTKVAVWEQVSLDEGVKKFSISLSDRARPGRWRLQVEADSAVFSEEVNISITGGPGPLSVPDLAAAEEHYVELRFGREMRRRYKPGLPFVGKVEAVSTEKSVRVRIKVYDNQTAIYSQDVEILGGEGTFIVPAILADSEVINLQAELVSVEGKEIESHYVLAREPVLKWNSSSECYLLVEGLEHTLQPEEEAHTVILSTCPCERDLHFLVTTDGHVTDWTERRSAEHITELDETVQRVDGAAICRLNYSFTVKAEMAPVSQLLVYYVTEQGEPISDVISFDVKLLHNKVSVTIDDLPYWLPDQPLEVGIVADPGAMVCLVGGRAVDAKFDPHASQPRSPAIANSIDFLEAGVSFFQRRCEHRGPEGLAAMFYRQSGSGAGPSGRRRPQESLVGGEPLDELWMWKCFNYSADSTTNTMKIVAPSEAGRWSLWALSVSDTSGLRFSSPRAVNVFRPLQVQMRPPPSLRVGETVEMDINIGNNLNSCMDITALLALSEGARFRSNGLLYVTEKLRLGPHGATSLVVKVLVTTQGLKNITVDVTGYSSENCDMNSSPTANDTLVGSVQRSANILVHPEGLVRTDTESAYFCANENMVISTSDKFQFEWTSAPRNKNGIVFEIKAGRSAHIGLSDARFASDKMYQIVLGDMVNTISWIGRGKHGYGVHLISTSTPDMLSDNSFRTFWVSWEKNTISFGKGPTLHNNTMLKWKMDKKMNIRHIGFASNWGQSAEFRVWNYNDEAGFSQVLHLDVPRSVVPGSEQGNLLISGGLAMPHTQHVRAQFDRFTSLAGSIASFTPLLVLEHIRAVISNSSQHEDVVNSLAGQIQTLLAFRKSDNSFSDHHMVNSHLSTVLTLEVLSKSQAFFGVDSELLTTIKRWIQLRQEDDGSFTPLPADVKIHTEGDTDYANLNISNVEKLSTLEHNVEMTAETLTTLLEVGIENEMDSEIVKKARYYLEKQLYHVKTSYPLAIMTYAMLLSRSDLLYEALAKLKNISTTEEGEFGWPRPPSRRDNNDLLYEEEAGRHFKTPLLTNIDDYKASVNALMVYTLLGDLKSAESVARYLFYRSHLLDKHPELLYSATKAFGMFGGLAYDRHRSLTISLATSGMELTDTLELRPNSIATELQLPSLPTKVFVYATGAGCATIQGRITYSTYLPANRTPLLDIWSGVVQEIVPERSSIEELEGRLPALNLKTCFKWKGRGPSGILRLEISLFSGYDLITVKPVIVDSEGTFADLQHGSKNDLVWFVFTNISSECPICVQYQIRSTYVISSLRPAFAKVYPVSRADLAAEIFFHTKRGSPLLQGITDDDLITWFGKTESGEPKMGTNFPDICMCGSDCENKKQKVNLMETTPTLPTTELPKINMENMSGIFYNLNIDDVIEPNENIILTTLLPVVNDTKLDEPLVMAITYPQQEPVVVKKENTAKGDELILQNNVVTTMSVNKLKDSGNVSTIPPSITETPTTQTSENNVTQIIVVTTTLLPIHDDPATAAGVLNGSTYTTPDKSFETVTTSVVVSEKQEVIKSEPKVILHTILKNSTKSILKKEKPKESKKKSVFLAKIKTQLDSKKANKNITAEAYKVESEGNLNKTNVTTPSVEHVTLTPLTNIRPIPKFINREKHHPSQDPMSETTLNLQQHDSVKQGSLDRDEKFLVMNRDALWGMLREFVHVELDQRENQDIKEQNIKKHSN